MTMIIAIQIGCQAVVTIGAVLLLALRLEHRLTKIETNIYWLMEKFDAERKS